MDATSRWRQLFVQFFAHAMLQNDSCNYQICFVIVCDLLPFIFQKWLMKIHKFQWPTIHWFQNDSKIRQQPQYCNKSKFAGNLLLMKLRDNPLILELSLWPSSLHTRVSSWQASGSFVSIPPPHTFFVFLSILFHFQIFKYFAHVEHTHVFMLAGWAAADGARFHAWMAARG